MKRFVFNRRGKLTSAWSGLAMSGFFVSCVGEPLKRNVRRLRFMTHLECLERLWLLI
jgi:hypothetical protein